MYPSCHGRTCKHPPLFSSNTGANHLTEVIRSTPCRPTYMGKRPHFVRSKIVSFDFEWKKCFRVLTPWVLCEQCRTSAYAILSHLCQVGGLAALVTLWYAWSWGCCDSIPELGCNGTLFAASGLAYSWAWPR